MENTVWICKDTCKGIAMEDGLLSVWVSQRIDQSWSMNIATFPNWDLQEQGRKSYVASQLSGERRIGDPTNVFLWTTSMKVIHESFLPRTILNIRYLFELHFQMSPSYS